MFTDPPLFIITVRLHRVVVRVRRWFLWLHASPGGSGNREETVSMVRNAATTAGATSKQAGAYQYHHSPGCRSTFEDAPGTDQAGRTEEKTPPATRHSALGTAIEQQQTSTHV